MIDFLPTDHVIGFWFVPGETSDWMACVWTRDKTVYGRYRFRYYDPEDPGNDPHSGQDRKSWYALKGKIEDVEKLEETMHMVAQMAAINSRTECIFVEVRDTGEKAAEILMKQPWAHAKKLESAKDMEDSGIPVV